MLSKVKVPEDFIPKIVSVWREGITREQLKHDITAGIIVGIVALPLAIAFAIASGVSPEKGLITAVVAGFLISALGGSRVQIGGPTGAFIVIVYGIVQKYGVEGLTYATLIAGFMILGMGLLRFGSLLKYVPHPLIVGFTSGIAIIIFSAQIKDFLGLQMPAPPSAFVEKWSAYASYLHTINPWAIGVGVGTILMTLIFPRLTTRVPASLLAILVSTVLVQVFQLPVATIETQFGDIPSTLPSPHFEPISFERFRELLSPAFAIAMLGGIESLLSAVVADGMIGSRHRSNAELVAQGVANIASGLVGGIPATGAIARTATNVKNGARTPIAGMVHALTLLVIMLAAGPYVKLIPLACLAGLLIVVAYNMGEWHNFASVFRSNFYDRAILLTVFLITVFFDLVLAIEIGMVLAAFLFVKRMADIMQVNVIAEPSNAEHSRSNLPNGVMVYEISGALFFGAAQTFQEVLKRTHQKPEVLILDMRNVPLIDATGLYRLTDVVKQFVKQGTAVFVTEYSAPVRVELSKSLVSEFATLHPSLDYCLKKAAERIESF